MGPHRGTTALGTPSGGQASLRSGDPGGVPIGALRAHWRASRAFARFARLDLKKLKKLLKKKLSEISSKTPLLQTSEKLTKLPLLQTSKNWRNCWKKSCSKFFDKFNFFYFFRVFISENVLKCILRGKETTRKKYRIVFEKFFKYVIFFDFACPPITTHHPSPPIRQYKLKIFWFFWVFLRTCLKKSSRWQRNNLEKILSNSREIYIFW